MILKSILLMLLLVVSSLVFSETVFVYSSFWAPLFSPRLLGYRVQALFEPRSAAGDARAVYQTNYGYRGETLIADLGNGNGPKNTTQDYKGYGDVKITYTGDS